MTQNITGLTKGQPVIAPFFSVTQEMLSGHVSPNFRLAATATNRVGVSAGTGHDQVSIAIGGKYRFITAAVQSAALSGAAGVYDVFVTASANNFTGSEPNMDLTVYAFALSVVAAGNNPGGVDLYRKVGRLTWSGSAITGVYPLVGVVEVPLVTALPASADDGQVVDFVADAANGIVWRFRYRAAAAGAYKWEFIGGSPLWSEDNTQTTFAGSGAGLNWGLQSPATNISVTTPALIGDFVIRFGGYGVFDAGVGYGLAPKIGAAAVSEGDRAEGGYAGGPSSGNIGREIRKTITTASVVIQLQARNIAGSGGVTLYQRRLSVIPVRVA